MLLEHAADGSSLPRCVLLLLFSLRCVAPIDFISSSHMVGPLCFSGNADGKRRELRSTVKGEGLGDPRFNGISSGL